MSILLIVYLSWLVGYANPLLLAIRIDMGFNSIVSKSVVITTKVSILIQLLEPGAFLQC
jgi:hypothetical protein